ncbi:solute carrier family 23 member 2-like [Octopus sinensis]|uniref:Solute carrier family 23 member 2-like n=1 Tax=Octopus sinensis TaxID=2607531 RepID=A0A6P7SVI5_9MOLL|nr:solute carrier family 23 member 2-like [Octopus sinensis]
MAEQKRQKEQEKVKTNKNFDIVYGINDVPPWYLCIFFGFQQYLTAFGSNFTPPLIISAALCMSTDVISVSELMGTSFFISGLSTILMTTFGCRLPILQGASFSFLIPTITMLKSNPESCPYLDNSKNISNLPEIGSDGHREIWQKNMRQLQGSLMVASLLQIVVGFSGLLEFFLPLIGPLTIAPTITLIGLSLFQAATNTASGQWYIAMTVVALMVIFSQYMQNIPIPCGKYSKDKGCTRINFHIFKMFPVVLAVCVVWFLCFIFTITDVFPATSGHWGHKARTDNTYKYLQQAAWFRFPYPGQWGVPTVSLGGVLGMISGVLASMIESIGDYYACARISGAPPPPAHAINRGIGVEGIGCLLAGAIGGSGGVTSYSENIGTIGITKIASRIVIFTSGIIMMVLGCFGKFGILLVTMPDPIVGGMFLVMFGMVAAVGISNLQHVNLESSRNLMILGVSLFVGLSLPLWIQANQADVKTGSAQLDQVLRILLSSNMFVGGFIGFVLDNTIPGTPEERGIIKWDNIVDSKAENISESYDTYSFPRPIQKLVDRWNWPVYVPFCPSYNSYISRLVKRMAACCSCRKKPTEPVAA